MKIVSGIIDVIKNGLQWKDAPPNCMKFITNAANL